MSFCRVSESKVNVFLGSVNQQFGVSYGVQDIVVHPFFNISAGLQNDLAVLRLDKAIAFTRNIAQGCLPEEAATTSTACAVSGWQRGTSQGEGD